MKRRRVKITGIGPVTPAGIGREEFWKGIQEPVSRVRPYTKIGEEFGPFVAAHITGLDVSRYLGDYEPPKGTARHTLFALVGAALALQDSGRTREDLSGLRCAVVSGSSLLDFGGIGSAIESVQKRGARGAQARVVYTTTLSTVPDVVSDMLRITARTMTLQTSCCAGVDAIGHAADLVATGEVDLAVCGGTESPLHRFPLLELRAAGLTPPTTELPQRLARPFDRWRTTGVVSEGACMLVLEPDTSPRPGYSYVEGYGYANDTREYVCSGLTESGRLALAQARIRPPQLDAISAWGPGHRVIDEGEGRAMLDLLGERVRQIPAVSIKGAVGAALGAAGAIQVAAAALSQRTGVIPPTVNWEFPDPQCPFNLSNQCRFVEQEFTLVNAHGVGSVNASLLLKRC